MNVNKSALACTTGLAALLSALACGDMDTVMVSVPNDVSPVDDAVPIPTLDEFKATTQYPGQGAPVYLVEDDILMSESQLENYYVRMYSETVEKSSVARRDGTNDTVWTAGERTNITYCVADSWGAQQSRATADMMAAVSQWMSAADVEFQYVPAQNAACSSTNTGVDLNVIPGSAGGAGCYPHACRYLEMNYAADFGGYTWLGAWTHEVGHTLGLAHEHIRSPCNESEGLTVRTLTDYDINSSMHYDTLCGSNSNGQMTALDRDGLESLYTAPASTALRVTPAAWVLAALPHG